MKIFFLALLLLAACVLAYWLVVFYQKYQISLSLIKETTAFQRLGTDHTKTLLVLGDSSGVGVGASKPEDSLAGRVATLMSSTYVENRAVSGAVVSDVAAQLSAASLQRYDVILIQIGGNDITHFHDAQKTADTLAPVLKDAVRRSGHVYLMSAGNVGAVTNFPPPMLPFYTSLTIKFHTAFTALAAKEGATYINLYLPPSEDPFTKDPETYLAADGFHPSSAGYGLWFEKLQEKFILK